ncbi:hypothetical protein STCU_00683 [Strigomonas culicis]|uniref:Uncharacterized protein n=1 Tax=Strigomonas culicis TaxID=28005 RepID=S9V5Z4_9TRYP|nr:hypothetical protein STCU_04047 [Strigomonas culicis]EPY36243.1 hypothetical protein STCU_00683 [Strigomonas culicis]|eukprot:EPY30476.1 hypothetical protein STCU_04047 [Strigomonas culicis]
MPGRGGKQRVKRKKSKRQSVSEMEKTLKDSIHGRKRKEQAILKSLVPPKLEQKVKKFELTEELPMFKPINKKKDDKKTSK